LPSSVEAVDPVGEVTTLEGKAMSRRPHFGGDRRALAKYDDVHRVFRHVGEVKLLEILALRPTAGDLAEVERLLRSVNGQRKRNSNRSPISAAIVGILAGSDAAL
jgi:hypothetical protein